MKIVTRQWMVHGSKTNLCAPVFRFGECRADSGDAVCPATNYRCFRGELASSFPRARKKKMLFEVGFCRSDAAELSDWKANLCQHNISTIFMTQKRTWIKVVPRIPCCRDSVPASAETRIVFQRREGIVVHRWLLDLGGHNADWPTLAKDHKWVSICEVEEIRRCFLEHFYWLRESTRQKSGNKNSWQI